MRLAAILCVGLIHLATAASAAELLGAVRDVEGAAIGNAKVLIKPGKNPSTWLLSHTDSFGAFHFVGIADGQYSISLAGSGFRPKVTNALVRSKKVLPPITLQIGRIPDCNKNGNELETEDFISRPFDGTGDLLGSVFSGEYGQNLAPQAGIAVILQCARDRN